MITFSLRSLCCAPVLVSLSFAVGMHAQTQTPEQRAAALVAKMTLPEKVSQMQNHAVAIPRLDIPEYDWWSEGLHGIARSGYATVFPQAIGLAATWDAPLMHQTATVISTEARAKNSEALRHDNHSIYFGLDIWSPNINIFRDPRWGRGQETYGEDPFLTSRMGVAFVSGLQGDDPRFFKTIATPKHFAVHSGPENTRHTVDVVASPHDLEDTYLPAFRATITEAHAGSTMCAYNSLDGQPACANTMLLHDILRGDWKFNGYVTSDCAAITDVAVGHKFAPDLEHAAVVSVRAGLIKESEIDEAVTRLFTARMRLGLFDPPASVLYAQIPFSENDSEEHRMLARKVSEESMVLLKNNGVLPLAKSVHTIAVIGPDAAALSAIEGNYNAVPSKPVVPLLGMERLFGESAILYAQGAPYVAEAAVPVPRTVLHPSASTKREGLSAEYFGNADFSGAPVVTRVDPQINFDWNAAAPVEGTDMKGFSVRWSGALTVPVAGDYTFSFTLAHCYPCNDAESVHVWVDDKEVSKETQTPQDSRSSGTKPFTVHFADNQPHALKVEYSHKARLFGAGITLDWRPNIAAERAEAVAIAQRADVVVAFVGLTPELEGEEMPIHIDGFDGGDRTSINLPKVQEEMLKAVGATGKPVIVVLLNGSDVSSPWAMEHAAAILDAWYPGEEGGTAIARTLAGENNPAGRLPVTFYASTEQIPAFDDYSMKGRTYRYIDGKPEFGFGFGLSYSKFVYSHLKLSAAKVAAGDSLTIEADVKNASARDGDEVAELYLVPPKDGVAPKLALESFSRLHMKAGETRHVKFVLDARQMSVVDKAGVRAVRAGTYGLALGGGQPSEAADLSGRFTVEGMKALPR